MVSDRTVHASGPDMEVVRYDRARKWYVEAKLAPLVPCQHVTVAQAVDYALWLLDNGGTVHLNKPGGGAFDSKVRRRLDAEVKQ